MSENKRFDIKWILLIILVVVVAVFTIIYISSSGEVTDKSMEEMMREYEELETAYTRAINEIEDVTNSNVDDISTLRKNLRQTLDKIKKEKEEINKKGASIKDDYIIFNKNELANNPGKMESLKEYANEMLKEQMQGIVKINENLQQEKDQLKKQVEETGKNLSVVRGYLEDAKSKNAKLNAMVDFIDDKLEKVENEKKTNNSEVELLKKQKAEYEEQLKRSDERIEKQNSQLNILVETLRKVNVDCYFFYEEGNKSKEAKIYLTDEGISDQYVKYFLSSKPNVHINFRLNEDLFKKGVEKLKLKIYNSKNVPVYQTEKAISSVNLKVKVPGIRFPEGEYYIELKQGNENLIIGGRYNFKISQ